MHIEFCTYLDQYFFYIETEIRFQASVKSEVLQDYSMGLLFTFLDMKRLKAMKRPTE